MKVLAFGASNSKNSINQKLALYAASLIPGAQVSTLNLNDYEMPLFGVDKEIPGKPQEKALLFLEKIKEHDLILISFAENNGSYSVAFKNVLDWASRVPGKVFQEKPMLLLATSPGARGGASVLEAAKARFPFMGGVIKGSFSLPEFDKNFTEGIGITNLDFKKKLADLIQSVV